MSKQNPQIPQVQMARGTKLTTQQLWNPLKYTKNILNDSNLDTTVQAPGRLTWQIPALDSQYFENPNYNGLYLPFLLPPTQDEWQNAKGGIKQPIATLTSLSISIDQRAEPMAVTDGFNIMPYGLKCTGELWGLPTYQQDRYTTSISLIERKPTALTGDQYDYQTVASFSIPGQDVFGNQYYRQNPFLIEGINVRLDPWKTYCWVIKTPGLATSDPTANPRLAMPSFMLECGYTRDLVQRDDVGVQNSPDTSPRSGSFSIVTEPSPNALINGESDIQSLFSEFDVLLENRLDGGTITTPGFSLEQPYWEQTKQTSAYSTIMVPLFPGYHSVQRNMVGSGTLPYSSPDGDPTFTADRRFVPVPQGFVLHSAYAIWNLTSPHCTGTSPTTSGTLGCKANGTLPKNDPDFVNQVGINLRSALFADDDKSTVVAGLTWTGDDGYLDTCVDFFRGPSPKEGLYYSIQNIPLVWSGTLNTANYPNSYYPSGAPFFMGSSDTNTATRSKIGTIGGTQITAPTHGTEDVLEIRWQIADVAHTLNDPADPHGIVLGQGGNWVLLVGKTPLEIMR